MSDVYTRRRLRGAAAALEGIELRAKAKFLLEQLAETIKLLPKGEQQCCITAVGSPNVDLGGPSKSKL